MTSLVGMWRVTFRVKLTGQRSQAQQATVEAGTDLDEIPAFAPLLALLDEHGDDVELVHLTLQRGPRDAHH